MSDLKGLQEAAKLFVQYLDNSQEELIPDEEGFITGRMVINGWLFRVIKLKDENTKSELKVNESHYEVTGFCRLKEKE